MSKICTDIEQSKKLIELGIDANTADMCYHFPETNKFPICLAWMKVHKDEKEDSIPAWSLSALLKLMPYYSLEKIEPSSKYYNEDYPYACYSCKCSSKNYKDPLDAAFEMICWLLENKKI